MIESIKEMLEISDKLVAIVWRECDRDSEQKEERDEEKRDEEECEQEVGMGKEVQWYVWGKMCIEVYVVLLQYEEVDVLGLLGQVGE